MKHSVEGPKLHLSEGLTVETFDGRRLGVVAEVGEDCFLTRRNHQEDFWLPGVFVRSVGATNVVLHVDGRGLRRYLPSKGPRRLRSAAALGLLAAAALTSLAAIAV